MDNSQDMARQARLEYFRKWRAANKDKVKQYNEAYWVRKAQKCLDCCCGQANEVKLCPISECSLYPYRFGRGQKRNITDEQRQALSEAAKLRFWASKSK